MPISAPLRLALTLRYLATGESQQLLNYRVGKATVSKIVSGTSSAIYNALKNHYLKNPWLTTVSGFEETWNLFPIVSRSYRWIECPKLSRTYYYNY